MTEVLAEPADWRSDQEILAAIHAAAVGPPYPLPRDGMVFANREKRLRSGSSYREFTVRTPGVYGRGSRRLIVDDATGRLFLTQDHYRSFSELIERDEP